MSQNKKPKIALISFTSCEGCQVALLSLGEKFFKLSQKFDIVEFSLIEEEEFPDSIDICFIEGTPIKKEDIRLLRKVRKMSRTLVVLGNCAALGGVQEIKNYEDREKILRYIYKKNSQIANPEIREIDNFVKVDFTLPGCPINAQEFLKALSDILAGKKPEIPQRPVCLECSRRGKDCLLSQGRLCFGPWILGGCGAPCPHGGLSCLGCRGFLKNFAPQKMILALKKIASEQAIKEALEIFGLRDDFEERSKTRP